MGQKILHREKKVQHIHSHTHLLRNLQIVTYIQGPNDIGFLNT